MHADETLRLAVVGGTAAAALERELEGIDSFELLPAGACNADCRADVVVLVYDAAIKPRTQLAKVREHTSAPVVFAAERPTTELVHWALDAGIADVLSLPVSREAAMFAIEKAAHAARRKADGDPQGRVVTVFSPKGGSGKSVVATNLAVAAAAQGRKRTLLVDLDLQFGDAAIMLGLSPNSTVRELIGTQTELDAEKLAVYTERHSSGVAVLPAPLNPAEAELVGEEAIRSLLTVARSVYDLVVVDTAPFFYGPMLATLDQTDRLLLLCNPDVPTLKNVRLTLKTLELLSFGEDKLSIVLNRANPAVMDRGDVEAALDRKVDFVLPLDASVPQAVNQATPAVLAGLESPFSGAMLELARSVVGGEQWPVARQAPRAARILSFGRN
ncbi:MAG TPA: AAA family ATPase [Gaiellaceae bacterium]|nr:AAA family ATPase [Gaiellaceae bacterium]